MHLIIKQILIDYSVSSNVSEFGNKAMNKSAKKISAMVRLEDSGRGAEMRCFVSTIATGHNGSF